MGNTGPAKYERALIPPCQTIRVSSYLTVKDPPTPFLSEFQKFSTLRGIITRIWLTSRFGTCCVFHSPFPLLGYCIQAPFYVALEERRRLLQEWIEVSFWVLKLEVIQVIQALENTTKICVSVHQCNFGKNWGGFCGKVSASATGNKSS